MADFSLKYLSVVISWARDSINLLGFPLGTDSFILIQIGSIQQSIYERQTKFAQINYWNHFQFLDVCIIARLFVPGMVPFKNHTFSHAVAVDQKLWDSFGSMLVLKMDWKKLLNLLVRMFDFACLFSNSGVGCLLTRINGLGRLWLFSADEKWTAVTFDYAMSVSIA